ncbi:PREDICTED: ATPase family AAA domain-containing protein 5 isoform X2 [Polistes canadensis]|uniref:ATPase family AAA domain-containing protein 5 isoform X2 n=1 Tax=Polistes canadensis TaxID=91411 RepID=UPI000718BBED|nr:PREDICTED: ATPase family AAA domain-containing protein 5 isoform X2 [Polistes canadensis]
MFSTMKDLTHYFQDNVKSREPCPNTSELNNIYKLKDGSEYSCRKKRTRVKIKISRRNSSSRVCNIVENKNDLIDKTPSPFSKSLGKKERAASSERSTREVKEKENKDSIGKTKEEILPKVNINYILIESDSDTEALESEINGKFSLSTDKQNSMQSQMECSIENYNGFKCNTAPRSNNQINKETIQAGIVYEPINEHKQSNAFQVLMNPNKSIDNISLVHPSLKNDTSSESKLLLMKDIKSHSKRKLTNTEDDKKIEEIPEKRLKRFKENAKKDNYPTTNNLLNFLSKSAIGLEKKDKIEVNTSTIVVEADVHMSEEPMVNSLTNVAKTKSDSVYKKMGNKNIQSEYSNIQTEYSNVDKIDLIKLEEMKQNLCVEENPRLLQRDKPKWSLRIKMLSPKNSDEEMLYSPISKIKCKMKDKKLSKTSSNNINECARLSLKINGQENNSDKLTTSLNHATQNDFTDDIIVEKEIKKLTCINEYRNFNENYINTNTKEISKNSQIIDSNTLKREPHKKLAPLFTRQSKPNVVTEAAKRSFFKSDTINNSSKHVEKKVPTCNLTYFPFPKISHIKQLNNKIQTNDELHTHKIRIKPNMKYIPMIYNGDNYKYISQSLESLSKSQITINASIEQNTEEVLAEIEKHCSDTRNIWETINSIAKNKFNVVQSDKSKSKRTKKDITKECDKKLIVNNIWTQKYKPTNSCQIVGNENAAIKLRDWLSRWKLSVHKEASSSGDEFYSSDCSFTGKQKNNQVAVLLGPHGSGKTAAVYAVTEELGYSVLEVNASSRRTGKKIFKELDEATKSHRIKKNGSKSLFKPILKEANNSSQNSLILLEDIDLIFEEDEGFISAISQLVSNTKRPIVMTCKDVCPHLNKMAPEQNRIYFQKVVGNRASTLLKLISLAETGFKISCECLAELLQNGDLRKALLQLQYLLVSGFAHVSKYPFNSRNFVWQDMKYYLYQPAIKETKKQKAKGYVKNNNRNILNNLASQLDYLSLLSSLIEINDPALDIVCTKPQSSLSLMEDTTPYSVSQSISSEIGEWISRKIIKENHLIGKNRIPYQGRLSLKKQLNEGVDSALSQITSHTLDNRCISLDYLPCVRTICRTEEYRIAANIKRGNRFFHYLSGFKLPASSTKPNILSAACKMLQEKS